ncbi:MAG TPA: hypothetical protein VFA39_13485 [Steroidobacteraceae bacterium]|nr:hypothetical protein [Steroidobacteraceae bacterium]
MKSIDAIEEVLAAHPTVRWTRLFAFSTKTKLQDRVKDLDPLEGKLVESALTRKAKDGSRFWDALLGEMALQGATSKRLLGEVFYHQPNSHYLFVEPADLRKIITGRESECLALNSKVTLQDGTSRHIPLLDFKLASKNSNHQLARDCISALGLRGFLLDSGRSYHFIGASLVSGSDLFDVLAKFVLLNPLADKAWAAHQLLERSASLRITGKSGNTPEVIDRV